MSDASHSRQPSMQIDQDGYRDQDDQQDIDGRGYRLVLPEDGYEWKKYGQKFIKNVGKVRSYFKCQRSNCGAKKRADWSTSEAGSLRVVYDGLHSHSQSDDHGTTTTSSSSSNSMSTSSTTANQYDLLTQVFGDHRSLTNINSHHQQRHDR
ncbi:probable WRKY transcription factor 43 [Juglans microcarpa x Juglans regia]|uniref:probable WRKY transcription factor 43 n=1 Tax=Juglans microcarpa x Juglans regia TaxID=2249226 RepID=UPI001B7F1CB3|nr:probable WRKY transcription factor 43 [Juglans microcarpa x Juglans regia]